MKVYIVTHRNGSQTVRTTHPGTRGTKAQRAKYLPHLSWTEATISAKALAAIRNAS